MSLTTQQLAAAIGCNWGRAVQWMSPLNAAMERYDIATPVRRASFLAQVGHESALLSRISENLNYSAQGLLANFPRHFTEAEALQYQRQPERIANRVYADRYGNLHEASGDGWRYRGRGLIQVTFKDNYRSAGDALGIDLVGNPDLLLSPENAAMSAAWYWNSRGCNRLADAGDIRGVTRVINGGYNGLDQRVALFDQALSALA